MKIVFATGNAHKLQEVNDIAKGSGVEFILPPEGFDPLENGTTFEENSYIKALEASKLSGMIALADDSGLCVEALDGAPGIYSARYAETPQARIDKLLNALDEVEHQIHPSLSKGGDGGGFTRRAKFVCAMTLVAPDGKIIFQTRGECHGEIAKHQSGTNGFGYDPIFIPTHPLTPSPTGRGERATIAELSEEEKNQISHRGKALRNVLEFLSQNKIG